MRVTQVGGMTVVGMSEDQEAFMQKRVAFVERYCKEHGLTKETMSIQQVLEMRKEEGWKNPQ
jgi:hypothetical protein